MSNEVKAEKLVAGDNNASSSKLVYLLMPVSQQAQTNASNHLPLSQLTTFQSTVPTTSLQTSCIPLINGDLLTQRRRVVSRPITTGMMSQLRKIPLVRKVPSGSLYRILCKNCGVHSNTDQTCSSCNKPLPKLSSMKVVQRNRLSGISTGAHSIINVSKNPSTFYGKSCSGGLAEFNRYCQTSNNKNHYNRKRPNTKSSECIMISDSDDEESANKTKRSSNEEVVEAPSTSVPEECNKRLLEGSVDEEGSSKLHETTRVPLTSVRIGQLKMVPSSCLTISGVDLSMTFPDKLFRLKWFTIKKLEICSNSNEPCIFIDLMTDYIASFRCMFQMFPGKSPYYDPNGPDDQKYIIFYIEKVWSQTNLQELKNKLNSIRIKLKNSSTFISEISADVSSARQLKVAELECMETDQSLKLPTLAKATRSSSKPKTNDIRLGFSGPRVQLAIFPPPPAKGGISITNEDEFCLDEGEFLNDVIIDFYLKYLMQELVSPSDRDRSHVFSCFFYKRLTQLSQGKLRLQENKSLSVSERRHMRVRKWTRGVDLFSKDFIFIPINDASHWYLAVICFPGKTGTNTVNKESAEIIEKPKTQQFVVTNIRSLSTPGKSDAILPCASSSNVRDSTALLNKSHGEASIQPVNGKPVICVQNGDSSVDTNSIKKPEGDASEPIEYMECQQTNDNINASGEHSNNKTESPVQLNGATNSNADVQNCQILGDAATSKCQVEDTAKQLTECSPSCILIFDSLRGSSRSKTATNLREYLSEEWKFRKSADHGSKVFDCTSMKMCSPHVPQQDNYSDCGVFLLHYVEKMFKNPIKDFTLPIKSLQNWFDPAEVKHKRSDIRVIIEKLCQMQST